MIKVNSKVELIIDKVLEIDDYGYKKIEVNSDNPCKGTAISIRNKKCGKKIVKMITFSPNQYPKVCFEFAAKNFREIEK